MQYKYFYGAQAEQFLMVELEKQAGLIERKRQGLGRPNLIYVKNFAATINDKSCEKGDS